MVRRKTMYLVVFGVLVTVAVAGGVVTHQRRPKTAIRPAMLNFYIDWTGCAAVERRPSKMSNAWCVKETRIPVEGVITNYNAGYNAAQLTTIFVGLRLDLAQEIIRYAAARS